MRILLLKFGVFCLLVLVATLLAGAYGALHDQVTYTISSEYFTAFKFEQFGFEDWGPATPRTATAVIGFLATWWVGLFAGLVLGLLGFIHATPKQMFRVAFRSILLTLAIAIVFAFVGGLVGWLTIDEYGGCLPYAVAECRRFCIVGEIHSFGYTGGEVGTVVGMAYQVVVRKKQARQVE